MLYNKFDDGVKVAVAPPVLTEPPTALPPPLTLKVSVVKVEPLMVSLKVAEMAAFTATPVAPLDGLMEETVT